MGFLSMSETEQELAAARRSWLRGELSFRNLSERDVALRCRYAVGEIRLWLAGTKPISAAVLSELAAALEVEPPLDLVGE